MSVSTNSPSPFQSLFEFQTQLQKVTIPWMTELEQLKKTWEVFDSHLYFDTLKATSALSKTISGLSIPSVYIPLMDEDVVDEELVPFSSDDNTEVVVSLADYSTRAVDVNKLNYEDLEYYRTRSKEMVDAMANTDCEDGMDNDVTELMKAFIRRNKFATYIWLNELYSQNLKNLPFVEGLLRTIAMVTEKGDETSLLPIVVAGLRSQESSEQEAAIMVVEEWRTKDCLDAMKTANFGDGWLKTYADKVMNELEKDLA